MKMYYPRFRFDGKKPSNYDQEVSKYLAKLDELEQGAVKTESTQGDYYDEIKYSMPDGSVWLRTISTEYMLEYSLGKVM